MRTIIDKVCLIISRPGVVTMLHALKKVGYRTCGTGEGAIIVSLDSDETYMDTETGEVLSAQQLMREYAEHRYEIESSSGARTFSEWLANCLGKNGFLEIM